MRDKGDLSAVFPPDKWDTAARSPQEPSAAARQGRPTPLNKGGGFAKADLRRARLASTRRTTPRVDRRGRQRARACPRHPSGSPGTGDTTFNLHWESDMGSSSKSQRMGIALAAVAVACACAAAPAAASEAASATLSSVELSPTSWQYSLTLNDTGTTDLGTF